MRRKSIVAIEWMSEGEWRCEKEEWREVVIELTRRLSGFKRGRYEICEEFISDLERDHLDLDRVVCVATPDDKEFYFLVHAIREGKVAHIYLLKPMFKY